MDNVYDALSSVTNLRKFCEKKLAVGNDRNSPLDDAYSLCMQLEEILLNQAYDNRFYELKKKLPSKRDIPPNI